MLTFAGASHTTLRRLLGYGSAAPGSPASAHVFAMPTPTPMTMSPAAAAAFDDDSPSLLDRLTVLYLTVPALLFFAGWMPILGWAVAALALFGVREYWPTRLRVRGAEALTRYELVIVAAATFALALLSGAGHFVPAFWDWKKHDAILVDLANRDWPVVFENLTPAALLRYYLGYYLVPAALAKAVSVNFLHLFVFLWTVVGLYLVLWRFVAGLGDWRKSAIAVLCFAIFGGLDVIGLLFGFKTPASPSTTGSFVTAGAEWWARLFQYSSNMTLLWNVPNQALSGWLVTGFVVANWNKAFFVRSIAPIVALLLLWSPFIALGVLPLLAPPAFWQLRFNGWKAALTFENIIAAPVIGGLLVVYLTTGTSGIEKGWIWNFAAPESIVTRYSMFLILEVLVIAAALYAAVGRFDVLTIVAVGTLCLLPLYHLGLMNDFAMRASIPALYVLCYAASRALAALAVPRPRPAIIPLALVFAIAAVSPAYSTLQVLFFWRGSPEPTIASIEQLLDTNVFRHVEDQYLAPVDGSIARLFGLIGFHPR